MSDPSLLNVPYRFKPGTLYSQIPDSGLGDFTVTRSASNVATRVNAQGFIETVADNVPRLDYPLGGIANGCPALLVEPSAQNVIVQSQNWLASGWRSDVSGNVTTVTGTTGTLDPLGTNTANAISPTSGNTSHIKVGSDGSASFTSGTIYTASAFFKQGTGNAGRYVQIAWPPARFAANTFANFDLQLGTVALVTGSTVTAGIENYGNGWYRCRCTNTCISTGTGANGISIALIETSGATRLPTFIGTTTDVLYGWGAQTETGSVATSYIPTTTAAVTRGADVISKTGVGSLIGQTEGTLYAEVDVQKLLGSVTRSIFAINDGTTSNRVQFIFTSTVSNTIRMTLQNSQTTNLSTTISTTGIYKLAVGYTQGGTASFFLNGNQVGTDSAIGSFSNTLSEVQLGSSVAGSAQFNDRIRAIALYTTRLSNTELQALTT